MPKKADINEVLRELAGLQTAETVAEIMGISRQGAINLVSRLKKQGHVSTTGGGKMKRIYRITLTKQLPGKQGMFDILNRYSPNFQLVPWYDHQVHGGYGPEDALVDAIKTRDFRALLAATRLFRGIRDWKKLYRLAKENGCWQEVGALYDVARLTFWTRRMPGAYRRGAFRKRKYLVRNYETEEPGFFEASGRWNVGIPFRRADMRQVSM